MLTVAPDGFPRRFSESGAGTAPNEVLLPEQGSRQAPAPRRQGSGLAFLACMSCRVKETRQFAWRHLRVWLSLLSILAASSGCALRTYAINTVGDAIASGNSVYETDDDIELVGGALPFGLKLTESLLAQSPDHRGLLLTACRGFTMYSYAFVAYEAELLNENDLDRARALRQRARKLYLRGAHYGFHALERNYPGLEHALMTDPASAVAQIGPKRRTRDIPLLYWTAAALGLAISASIDDAALLARLPEVEAMLDRALTLDEAWAGGALHEFKVVVAGAQPGASGDRAAIEGHYRRALDLSKGASAGLFVAYAEAVSLPGQNKT